MHCLRRPGRSVSRSVGRSAGRSVGAVRWAGPCPRMMPSRRTCRLGLVRRTRTQSGDTPHPHARQRCQAQPTRILPLPTIPTPRRYTRSGHVPHTVQPHTRLLSLAIASSLKQRTFCSERELIGMKRRWGSAAVLGRKTWRQFGRPRPPPRILAEKLADTAGRWSSRPDSAGRTAGRWSGRPNQPAEPPAHSDTPPTPCLLKKQSHPLRPFE